MRTFIGIGIAMLLVGCVPASPELGEDITDLLHLKGGQNSAPSFVDQGTQLLATGEFSGVGNKDLTIELFAIGMPTGTCSPIKYGLDVPVLPATIDAYVKGSIAAKEVKNGTVSFSLLTAPPEESGCTISDVQFTTAWILVRQDGQVVFRQSWNL